MTTPHASATLLSSLSEGSLTGSSAAMSSRSLVNVCCFEFGEVLVWYDDPSRRRRHLLLAMQPKPLTRLRFE